MELNLSVNKEERNGFSRLDRPGIGCGFYRQQNRQRQREGILLDIVLGIVGALIGGVVFRFLGMSGATGLNLWSLLVAVVGSVIVLALYHAFRRTSHRV